MASDLDIIRSSVVLMGGGSLLFLLGLRNMKLRRKMGDIPQSKISSAAVGSFVEIRERVYGGKDTLIISPLTKKKGQAFIWELQKKVFNGRGFAWQVQGLFYSTPYLYLHEKNQHLAAIDLACCEFQEDIFETVKEFNDFDQDLPAGVSKLLNQCGLATATGEYQIREKVFKKDELLYVLGTAISPPAQERSSSSDTVNRFGSRHEEVKEEIELIYYQARKHHEIVSEYDKDGDQKLSSMESRALYKDIENKILDSYKLNSFQDTLENTRILFTDSMNNQKVFSISHVFVSKKAESDLRMKLLGKSSLFLLGGPLLVVFGLWALLSKMYP